MKPDPSSAPAGAEVVLTRTFDAPSALVWQAWTDPARLRQWWGPTGDEAPPGEVELRVGGRFRIQVCGPDGGLYPCRGIFREIVPNRRLVLVGDVDAAHACGAGLPPGAVVTITFTGHADHTTLTLHTRFANDERRAAAVEGGYTTSWVASLEVLARFLG